VLLALRVDIKMCHRRNEEVLPCFVSLCVEDVSVCVCVSQGQQKRRDAQEEARCTQ
jgi:hypothetical protein